MLHRKAVESPSLEIFKNEEDTPNVTLKLILLCMVVLDQMTSRGHFQPKLL